MKLIRGKLFPDRYLHPIPRLLISTAFVVVSRVGCLGVTGVMFACALLTIMLHVFLKVFLSVHVIIFLFSVVRFIKSV